MRRSLKFPLVLAVVVALGLVAPATVAAGNGDSSRKEVVTFVSRAELIAKGLIVPATGSSSAGTQALCVWDCIYVKNRRYLRTFKPFVTMVQGNGPTTIAIDITRTVKNSFSANVSVSAEVVTAGRRFQRGAIRVRGISLQHHCAERGVLDDPRLQRLLRVQLRGLAGAVHRFGQEDRDRHRA